MTTREPSTAGNSHGLGAASAGGEMHRASTTRSRDSSLIIGVIVLVVAFFIGKPVLFALVRDRTDAIVFGLGFVVLATLLFVAAALIKRRASSQPRLERVVLGCRVVAGSVVALGFAGSTVRGSRRTLSSGARREAREARERLSSELFGFDRIFFTSGVTISLVGLVWFLSSDVMAPDGELAKQFSKATRVAGLVVAALVIVGTGGAVLLNSL